MEILLGLLGIGLVVVYLATPLIVFSLQGRVGRLEEELRKLRSELNRRLDEAHRAARTLTPPPVTPSKPTETIKAPPAPSKTQRAADDAFNAALTEAMASEAAPPPPAAPAARDISELAPSLLDKNPQPALQTPATPPPLPRTPRPRELDEDWSSGAIEWLAERWMAWVGAAALLMGLGFFLKYAIERGWIGPEIRVGMGLVFAVALYGLGAWLLRRDYRPVGQGVAGASLGFWYLSLYAGCHWHGFFPEEAMFALMAVGAGALLALAVAFHAQPVAVLGVLGGFLAPLLMKTSTPSPWPLFRYLLLVDAATLAAASFRRWRVTEVVAFAATALMWGVWFSRVYTTPYLDDVLWLLSLYFLLFVGAGVWNFLVTNRVLVPDDLILVFVVPALYSYAIYELTRPLYSRWHGAMATGLAAVYAALSIVGRRLRPDQKLLVDSFMGIALTFLAAAIPLQFTGHWIPIVGAAYAAVLVTVGLRRDVPPLRAGGFVVVGAVQVLMAVYVLAAFEHPDRITPWLLQRTGWIDEPFVAGMWTFINGRSLAMLANVLSLAWIAREYRRHPGAVLEWEASIRDWAVFGAALGTAGTALLETFAYVEVRHWPGDTLAGLAGIELAVLVAGLATLAARIGPRWLFDVARAFAILLLIMHVMGAVVLVGEGRAARLSDQPLWSNSVLLNPRGFANLALLLAALYVFLIARSRPEFAGEVERKSGWTPSSQFAFLSLIAGWLTVATETFALSQVQHWTATQTLAFSTVHVSALVAASIVMTIRLGPPSSSAIAVIASIALGVMCLGLAGQTFDEQTWRKQAEGALWLLPAVVNPRGLAFICAAASLIWFARLARRLQQSDQRTSLGNASLYQFAALLAHTVLWLAITVEVYAAGLAAGWSTGKSLAVTIAWTLYGLVLFGVGLGWRWTSVRLASLAVFVAATAKVFLLDVWDLAPVIRYVAFIGLGVALLSTSYFYHRFQDRLREFIANPDAKL